jgi:hypothetical protein
VLVAVVGIVLSGGGCAGWEIPNTDRPRQDQAIVSGKGARTQLLLADGSRHTGELISAGDGFVWLLYDDGRLASFPAARVRQAWLGVFRTYEGALAGWTAVGSLTTVSHGFFLVFTLPLWLLTGSTSSYLESMRGFLACPPESWDVARRYARFPQGLTERMKARLLGEPIPPQPPPAAVRPTAGPAETAPGPDAGAPSVEVPPPDDAGAPPDRRGAMPRLHDGLGCAANPRYDGGNPAEVPPRWSRFPTPWSRG